MAKEKIFGIAITVPGNGFIDQWLHANASEVELVEKKIDYSVKADMLVEYIKDLQITDEPIDGIVLDTKDLSDRALNRLHEYLESHSLKLYSARGETSRPSWKKT